jgi:carboxyl-terminal processing protease
MEMTAAAAEGLDNFSSFLTADQLRDVYSQIEGNFVGLGVELKPDDGALMIVHVIPGSPAERSGIRSGDRIVAVDGQATSELSTDEAAALLTGEEGSTVRVTMAREREATRTVQVRREHVDVPALEDVQLVDRANGVAYIRIPAFQKTTAQDVEAALWKLHEQGMRSLIIDLRGNPGGLLTASVELADKFVASGGIVSTRGRSHAEDFDYRAQRAGTWRVPLVVLIDGDSASASEIFAAAIKDSARGKIVGSRSYGKGSVQGIFPLGFGGTGIRLTTAKFYSPLGRPISKFGVSPDIGTRPATLTTEGVAAASENAQFVGFRGVDAAADGIAANDTAANDDSTLTTAIEVARNEPVPVL